MCFSATASFTAGAALSATGIATLREVKEKRGIPLGMFPLLFGIQQITEGAVWLSFGGNAPFIHAIATHIFLFFAYVLWPMLVPTAVALLETDTRRKTALRPFQLLGAAIGLYFFYFLVTSPVHSHVLNNSIVYSAPNFHGFPIVELYVVATSFSCLFSSSRIIVLLGSLAAVSLMIAYYFYTVSFASVWCFFAAILSIVVYWYFKNR